MNRRILTAAVLFTLCTSTLRAQIAHIPPPGSETRSFDLTATPPPIPALKYQFVYPYSDRLSGNAAPLLLDAILLMGPTAPDTAGKAIDAYDAKDFKTFDTLADSLILTSMWQELDPAIRRMDSNFDPPIREMAEQTLLPHLQSLRSIGFIIKVRALRLTEQGKLDDAISTLRLGYELADKITDPVVISSLVSIGCTRLMNDTLPVIMNHPDAPNLYWALSEIPSRRTILRRSWDAESDWVIVCHPFIARLRAGQEPTADQWHTILIDDMAPFYTITGQTPHPDPIKDASADILRRAQQDYADSHHVTPDQAAKLDPAILLGHFYFRQWKLASDDLAKIGNLPYPAILAKTNDYNNEITRLKKEQPTNPFFKFLSDMHRVAYSFARTDRELAALTTVEALRSYASSHDGSLPAHLEDITETPAPINPATGDPFEYQLENNVATLSDTHSESHLTYTVRLRK
ncbi:MAG TPA: hypothetical protein VFE58_05200 [Tepidisphaeraceae bacterium]|jgi:hypothetical protein|nr:hypothetical protein [Tepidisphaeraceae bacterium]